MVMQIRTQNIMYTYISWLFAFAVQISFGEKDILCKKPREFRLIEQGELLNNY
jgi:hypothetical protein